ncbi:hypothetical protein BDP27DRAFT_1401581 [Rhodocollybia butyracea]|uniref:F-box domain-containing protein n=1 Tax=Rhodocollybia butyracea TaxID=206335 RepID=A0A9P5U9P2_9AGAR|nr:hypothetical protein BDP27DRAFT_1401581 [Rhodocollybia butyracea]
MYFALVAQSAEGGRQTQNSHILVAVHFSFFTVMAFSTDSRSSTIISVESFQSDQILYSAYQQRAHLRALIARTRSDLDLYPDLIIRLQILKTLDLQESPLALIQTVPSEILTEIFDLVIGTKYQIRYRSFVKPRRLRGTIFTLTWVCARWRNEALERPEFWSRIGIDLPIGDDDISSLQVLKFMQECILHSGSYVPMDIRINVESNTIAPAHLNVLGTLVATLDVGDKILHLFDAELARSGSESLFPLLEELSIQFIFDGNLRQNRLAPMFYYIPPLQKLEVSALLETDTINLDTLTALKVELKVDSFVASHVNTPPSNVHDAFPHPILSVLELEFRPSSQFDTTESHTVWRDEL